MKLAIILSVISLLSPAMASLHTTPGPQASKELVMETFAAGIAHDYSVVLFRSPYSSHTTHFKPKWEELVKHEDKVPKLAFAEVNCIEQGDLCKAQGIRGFPTLHIYKDGMMLNQFKDERTLPVLHEWIAEQMRGPAGSDAHNHHGDRHEGEGHQGDHFNNLPPHNPFGYFTRPDVLFGLFVLVVLFAYKRRLAGVRRWASRTSNETDAEKSPVPQNDGEGGGKGLQLVSHGKTEPERLDLVPIAL